MRQRFELKVKMRFLLGIALFLYLGSVQSNAVLCQSNDKLIRLKRLPVSLPDKIEQEAHDKYAKWEIQKKDTAVVMSVKIIGNKITKDWIILRELRYDAGTKIPTAEMDSLLKLETNKIFNTGLFVTAKVGFLPIGNDYVDIYIEVREKLYTYAFPVFDLVDRNFNEWWKNQGRDLSRTEYGVNFRRRNVRGRNESLNADFRWGFNRKLRFSYNIPYINKARTLGLSTGFQYLTNRNIPYRTDEDKLTFYDSENTIRKRFRYNLSVSKRDSFYTFHTLSASFAYEEVTDSVLILNPFYYGDTKQRGNSAQAISLSYNFVYDFTDIQAYPLNGKYLNIKLTKFGLGIVGDINTWEIYGTYHKFTHLGGRFYLANQVAGRLSAPNEQPYSFSRGFGFGQDFVRGYDLYVVDADRYAYNRNTLRFKVIDKIFNVEKFVPFKQFNTLPVLLMLKVYFDNGFSENKGFTFDSNQLDNRWLYGGGVGLDVFSFYNSTIRMEYSLNGHGDKGFFLYYNVSF